MEGTRIVLVRHGESMAQELRIVGGHTGCQGLSERGRLQVKALRDRLKSTGEVSDDVALYSSVMPRAVETASIIAPVFGDVPIEQDCDLCEHHPGEGDGLAWDEFDQRWPLPAAGWDPHLRRDPGGETWAEMADRVARGMDRLVERHTGGTIVVACHGGVIVQSMIRWLGIDPAEESQRAWFSPQNASITEWSFGTNPYGKRTTDWQFVRFNDHAHLNGLV